MIKLLLISVVLSTIMINDDRTLTIESDSAIHDYGQMVSIWNGNVIMREGDYQLVALSVEVKYDDNREPVLITAAGEPVKASGSSNKGTVHVEGEVVVYDRNAGIVSAKKQAKVLRSDQSVTANNIIYDFIQKNLRADGETGNKVKIVLPPGAAE